MLQLPKRMKKVAAYFFLTVFYTVSALANGTSFSRAIPNKSESITNEQQSQQIARTARRNNATKNITKQTVSRNTNKTNFVDSTNTLETKRSVSVTSRSANIHGDLKAKLSEIMNESGRNSRVSSASINNTAAVKRAGITLRPSTAEVGGRAKIAGTDIQTGSNIDEQIRGIRSRASLSFGAAKTVKPTAESIAEAKDVLDKTSELNNTCQQQYNECMDQFCAVVDTNQKRCSCSANLSKYAKVEEAVESANTELNDVAQRIRYVGLSADEIHAIMSATEAEIELSGTKDNTETRSMLEDIADLIQDPSIASSAKSSNLSSSSLLDMDLDFTDSDMFSLSSLNDSSSSISSLRGTKLYEAAKKRCKSVLNQCKTAGGTEAQITGNYDLAIDKDCIAYEQGLEKLNTTLKNNVRSAGLMLQKARLAVLENKNQYDIKGCVGALETCMLDEMVCGDDYVKCLDPTKKYIDENGKVVLGQNISNITDSMSDYDNSEISQTFIEDAMQANTNTCDRQGHCIVKYLLSKIGTGATVKDGGLCRAVLDKCQDYTYVSGKKSSTYNKYNEVIINYIQRAMVNIKAAQQKIISDYASTCMTDVATCYNQQVTQINSWNSSANTHSVYQIISGACHNVALTCGYAVFAYDKKATDADYINSISESLAQSLLCPDNSYFVAISPTFGTLASLGYVNDHCKCESGYSVSGEACVSSNLPQFCAVGYLDSPEISQASYCAENTTSSCTSLSKGEWRVTIGDIAFKGSSYCSNSTAKQETSTTTSNNKYCWCKVDTVDNKNYSSSWIYSGYTSDSGTCASSCSLFCRGGTTSDSNGTNKGMINDTSFRNQIIQSICNTTN